MIRSGVSVSDRIVWRIFSANSAAAEPALALAGGQDDVAQVGLERGDRGPGGRGGRVEARAHGGDRRIVGRGGLGRRQRVGDQLLDARQLVERGLGLEPPDGPALVPDERGPCRLEHGRQALEPAGGRGQAVGQRRELAGEQA